MWTVKKDCQITWLHINHQNLELLIVIFFIITCYISYNIHERGQCNTYTGAQHLGMWVPLLCVPFVYLQEPKDAFLIMCGYQLTLQLLLKDPELNSQD